jgi:hypothetical protein
MPLVRFLGFQTGDTVALSASQGGTSDSVSIAGWRTPPAEPALTVETTRGPSSFRCAPEAVWFEATPSDFAGLTVADGADAGFNVDLAAFSGWGAADFDAQSGYTAPDFGGSVDVGAAATIAVSGVSVGSAPEGVLFESGFWAAHGALIAFNTDGTLEFWVGDARGVPAENATTGARILVPSDALLNRTIDIYAVVDPGIAGSSNGRLKVYVFDATTGDALLVDHVDSSNAWDRGGVKWTYDGEGLGVGTSQAPVRYTRTGVDQVGPFNGALSGVRIWNMVPSDFADDDYRLLNPTVFEPEFHEIFYEWDFGDQGATYAVPQNTVPAFRDANRQFGKFACHVFTAPGTYTVTCRARQITGVDPLTVVEAQASVEVTVGDFETEGVFDAGNTVVLAADGDFTGAPAGAHVTAPADRDYGGAGGLREALETAARSVQYGNQAIRLLLKRGESDLGDPFAFAHLDESNPWRARHYLIGSWGDPAAANPQVGSPDTGASGTWVNDTTSIVVDGVDVVGDYDPVTGTGTTGSGWVIPASQSGQYRLQHRANVSRIGRDADGGIANNFQFYGDADWMHVISECVFSENKTYTIFGNMRHRGRLAVLGCRDTDRADVQKGTAINDRNSQGPVRLSEVGDFLCDGCDFFCNYGWSNGGTWPDGTAAIAVQPIFRLFQAETEAETGGRAIITRNGAEIGAGGFVNITGVNVAARGNALVQGNFVLTTAMPGPVVGAGMGGVTTRGNLHVMPDVAGAGPLRKSRSYGVPTGQSTPRQSLQAEPVADYSNTVVCLNGQSDFVDDVDVDQDFLRFTVSNNVLYAPGIPGQPGHVDLSPFDASPLFDPRFAGRLEPSDATVQTQYATPDDTPSLYRPQDGSPVIGAATAGYLSFFDLLGNARGAPAASGAVEPS